MIPKRCDSMRYTEIKIWIQSFPKEQFIIVPELWYCFMYFIIVVQVNSSMSQKMENCMARKTNCSLHCTLLIRYINTACGFDIKLFYTVKNTLFSYKIQGYFTSYTCKHYMINVFDGFKLRILIAVEQFQYCRCFACYFFWLQVHKMCVFNGGIFRKACAFISNFQAIYFRILL